MARRISSPKIVRLGYHDWKLRRSDALLPDDDGYCSFTRKEVTISKDQDSIEEANTILHEFLHAILQLGKLPITERDDSEEEQLVTVVANMLTELWIRNPELINYLNYLLGEKNE